MFLNLRILIFGASVVFAVSVAHGLVKTGDIQYVRSPTPSEVQDKLIARIPDVQNVYSREPEPTRKLLNDAGSAFFVKDYKLSARRFYVAMETARSPLNKGILANLVTASLFGSGEHRIGLRFICERYREAPASDHRYRHDIHSHLRRLALREGRAEAVSFLKEFKADPKFSDCSNRADFSPIWIGIPIEIMWGLLGNEDKPATRAAIPPDERRFLEHWISENDAFSDYALYALGRFDEIIDSPSPGYIRDMALFSSAMSILSDEKHDVNQAISALEQYVSEFPNGPNIHEIADKLYKLYSEIGNLEKLKKIDRKLGHKVGTSLKKYGSDIYGTYSTNFGKRNKFSESFHNLEFPDAISKIDEFVRSLKEMEVYRETAGPSDSETEFGFFDAMVKHRTELVYGQDFLAWMNKAIRRNDETQLFDIANVIKRCGDYREGNKKGVSAEEINQCTRLSNAFDPFGEISFHRLSSKLFLDIAIDTGNLDLSAKSYYLGAMAAKRNDDYPQMLELLREFEKSHGEHTLIDDVLTEIGWYYLTVKKDFGRAERQFRQVVDNFKGSNSYDNALNWLVILNQERADYFQAVVWSGELLIHVASERLKRKISGRSSRIKKMSGLTKGRKFRGIEFANDWSNNFFGHDDGPWRVTVSNVLRGSPSYSAGLRPGDRILGVNGKSIYSVDDLVRVLLATRPTDRVTIYIAKKGKLFKKLPIRIKSRELIFG